VKIHLYTYKNDIFKDFCSLHTCFSADSLHNALGTFFSGHPVYSCVCMVDVGSWPAVCIHGDKSQPERDHVLQGMIDHLTVLQGMIN